ncbi:hypothetical protein P171DRAFT_482278 [Karstenula rhodostoma CBS 690.94]|uniref:Uncharacterized protein n=1 Tax=Karstenula rhodostoma CBS 690.94 TaxID=1392251 RepID=A0A9P4UD81_9PLEO|nr:hypothetical protein P171DRAFT_482278 [Karstenula rhodostoma CBS 690.94]
MDSLKGRQYGRSVSMPLLPGYTEGEAEQDHAMESSWEQVLQDIQLSPGYQLLFSQSGPASHARRKTGDQSASSPTSFQSAPERGESSTSSPGSDDTIRPGDILESGGIAVTPTRPEPQLGGSTPPVEKTVRTSVPQLSPHALVFQPTVHPGSIATPERPDTPQEDINAYRTAQSDPRSDVKAHCYTPDNYSKPSLSHPVGVSDMGSPLKNEPVGDMTHRFSLAEAAQSVPQTTPTTQGTIHHRRVSSKFSFVPTLPSPLGPGHYTDDLGSDISGLVSPETKPAPLPRTHTAQQSNLPALSLAPAPRIAALTPAAVPFSWTQNTTPDIYSPFDTSPASDPFVERDPPPTSTPAGFAPVKRKNPTPPTPYVPRTEPDNTRTLRHPVTGLSTHSSIPPPSFTASLALALPQPSPTARARLTAQKPQRKTWIETTAAHLATAAHNAARAKHAFESSRRPADYAAFLAAQAVFLATWDLDALVAQRRELTMPEGMRALRAEEAGDGLGEGEGRVLGGGMAVMERVCAEVVGREDAWWVGVGELSWEEKRAVRGAVVRDIRRGVERRVGWKGGVGYQP